LEIVLVKQTDNKMTDQEASVVRRFLFEYIDGLNLVDKRAWRRFCGSLNDAAEGEYFLIKLWRQRSGVFHRGHMKMMSVIFEQQETFEDFRIFRSWVKLGAGFVDYVPNGDGELIPVPKSVNFDDCSEDEMRLFHEDACNFFRTEHAQKILWPSLSSTISDISMNEILKSFERLH